MRDRKSKQLIVPSRLRNMMCLLGYNETMVMEMVWKVEGSEWTRDQKRMTVAHCLTVARGFRRHPVVLALESLRQKLK